MASDLTAVPERKVSYKAQPVMDFIKSVFHSPLEEGEEILTFSATRALGYPNTVEGLEVSLRRGTKPKAFYYGTSTCKRAPDGDLYNRQALFCRMHAIVLDDIGSKIAKDKMPEGLEPSYIIESSAGNEQWGFIFDDPIKNLEVARMFTTLVYHSGYTDTGGAMPCKAVRLPCGFNMKPDQVNMPVKLLDNEGPLWCPDELLTALGVGVTMDQIKNTPEIVARGKLTQLQGATPWSPTPLVAPTATGIVDPALEWLYAMDMVLQERDEWVDIICPWCEEHTEQGKGKNSAGYAPVGWGSGENANRRGFNCFHDSCSARTSSDFIEYVATNGGPELSAYDPVPDMTSRYVFDATVDGVWDLYRNSTSPLTMSAFNNRHPKKVLMADPLGKFTKVPCTTLWKHSDARVEVDGAEYFPGSRSRLFTDPDGHTRFNLFTMPEHPLGDVVQDKIQMFYDYLEYLIPDEEEREYFTDWLACKVQDPTFRGAAMFMVAQRQGVGRNTLTKMLGHMFGHQHMAEVFLTTLTNNSSFNTYMESLFVVVSETLAIDDYSSQRRTGDALKGIVDPAPQRLAINPKYGKQRHVWTSSSFIFLSNHEDGLALTDNDRRYYAIRNAETPATPTFFKEVNAWIEGHEWEHHLWNDLLARKVDVAAYLAPPEASKTMAAVIAEGRSSLDIICRTYTDAWPTPLVPRKLFIELIDTLAATPQLLPENSRYIGTKVWNSLTRPADSGSSAMHVEGTLYRFRVKAGNPTKVTPRHPDWGSTLKAIKAYNPQEMLAEVVEALEDGGKSV